MVDGSPASLMMSRRRQGEAPEGPAFPPMRFRAWKLGGAAANDPGNPALRAADHPHCWQETTRSTQDGGRGLGRVEASRRVATGRKGTNGRRRGTKAAGRGLPAGGLLASFAASCQLPAVQYAVVETRAAQSVTYIPY